MDEDSARRLLLVRAVESEDVAESLLTRQDRHYATGAALAHAPVVIRTRRPAAPRKRTKRSWPAARNSHCRGWSHVTPRQKRRAVRWLEDFFQCLIRLALLRYLAVAHFGRGRGDYEESEHPAFGQGAVAGVVESRRDEIRALWERGKTGDAAALAQPLEALLAGCAARLLAQFYPEARELFPAELQPRLT